MTNIAAKDDYNYVFFSLIIIVNIWLTYLFVRNAQNIYAPQIQIDLLFFV